jgi:hypothetical protein
MGRRRVRCVVLECDRCGMALEGPGAFAVRYPQNQARDLEQQAETLGWSTDGRGRWHCAGCPDLAPDAGGDTAGQGSLEELGEGLQECLMREAGLSPAPRHASGSGRRGRSAGLIPAASPRSGGRAPEPGFGCRPGRISDRVTFSAARQGGR